MTIGVSNTSTAMGHNEAASIAVLKEILRDRANEAGGQFSAYPLGPQDRNLLADDIFATADFFAIVESKWSEKQLPTEAADKFSRVEKLCRELSSNSEMASLHSMCHKIAWRDSSTGLSMLQPYRDAVCKERFASTCVGLKVALPIDADFFADGFFGAPPVHCVPAADFIRYVTWLLKTVTGDGNKSVVVLAREKNLQGKSISVEITLEELSTKLARKSVHAAITSLRPAEQKPTSGRKGPK
jgi:hypothetical protein